jgi:hypothetical protein
MTQMMCFKFSWNQEIICQFYSTLYFDADGQRLLWMTNGQRCVITIQEIARMLGIEHQLTMLLEGRIHTYNVLKLNKMQSMYAPGVAATPPKIWNILPELNTLHYLLHATMTPRIGDVTVCPQYERSLIPFYVQKKRFLVFDFILQEIINISRIGPRSCGYPPQIMMLIERVIHREFLKDQEITNLKPQNLIAPTISMDVPSSSAAPRHPCDRVPPGG